MTDRSVITREAEFKMDRLPEVDTTLKSKPFNPFIEGLCTQLTNDGVSEVTMEMVEDSLLDYAKHANSTKEKIDILSKEIGFTWAYIPYKMNYIFKAI